MHINKWNKFEKKRCNKKIIFLMKFEKNGRISSEMNLMVLMPFDFKSQLKGYTELERTQIKTQK